MVHRVERLLRSNPLQAAAISSSTAGRVDLHGIDQGMKVADMRERRSKLAVPSLVSHVERRGCATEGLQSFVLRACIKISISHYERYITICDTHHDGKSSLASRSRRNAANCVDRLFNRCLICSRDLTASCDIVYEALGLWRPCGGDRDAIREEAVVVVFGEGMPGPESRTADLG